VNLDNFNLNAHGNNRNYLFETGNVSAINNITILKDFLIKKTMADDLGNPTIYTYKKGLQILL